jgi:hypothetical protein
MAWREKERKGFLCKAGLVPEMDLFLVVDNDYKPIAN